MQEVRGGTYITVTTIGVDFASSLLIFHHNRLCCSYTIAFKGLYELYTRGGC